MWKINFKFFFRESQVFVLFRISYIWYSAIGFFITIVLGILGSFATGFEDPREVDGDLLSPPIRNFLHALPDKIKEKLNIPLKQYEKPDRIRLSVISTNIAREDKIT